MAEKPTREPLALTVMMVAYGFSVTAVGSLLPVFLKEFSVSPALGGAVAGMQGVGGIATLLLGGAIADRIDKRRVISVSFGVYAILLSCAAFIGSYATLLALFFSIGFVTRMLDALANARTADISRSGRSSRLSLLHAAFGVGALIGPLYLQFASALVGWRLSLAFLGLASALIWLAFRTVWTEGNPAGITAASGATAAGEGKEAAGPATPAPLRASSKPADSSPLRASGKPAAAAVLADPGFWLLLGAMALYSVHQTGVSVWLPTYLIERFTVDPVTANASLSLYWASIVAGRLAVSRLKGDAVPGLVLVRGAAAAGAVLALALLSDSLPALFFAVAFAGFASGAVIPVLVAQACAAHPEASGAATSGIFVVSSGVRILVPSAIGLLMGAFGERSGFGSVALSLIGSALFAFVAPAYLGKNSMKKAA